MIAGLILYASLMVEKGTLHGANADVDLPIPPQKKPRRAEAINSSMAAVTPMSSNSAITKSQKPAAQRITALFFLKI